MVWLQVSVTEVKDVAKAWDHREYSIIPNFGNSALPPI